MVKTFVTFLLSIALSGCGAAPGNGGTASSSLPPEPAASIDCGTVEFKPAEDTPAGYEHFTAFWELSGAERTCSVKLIRHTVEGDPVQCSISFDGTAYTCVEDNTADQFAAPENRTTVMTTWKYLFPVETCGTLTEASGDGQILRDWVLSNDDYDTYIEKFSYTDGIPDAVSLFTETVAPSNAFGVECGIYEQPATDGTVSETSIRSFLHLCRNGTPAHVRIIRRTVEGDPIVHDVLFDGTAYSCTTDATADRFGPQEITTHTWKYLLDEEFVINTYSDGAKREVRRVYTLSDVSQAEIDAHPLAEYAGQEIFEENITYR